MDGPLPFSQACENNKGPILKVLRRHLDGSRTVLEIGGGTGQHAEHFARNLPHVRWQSSDVPDALDALNRRIRAAGLANLPDAVALDVDRPPGPGARFDAVFTANSLHIMGVPSVENLFAGLGALLGDGARLLVYGPFRYGGAFTTPSNARFDHWLKARDPAGGVRDFEWVDALARKAGLALAEDNAMPANNQLIVWRKAPG